MRKCVLITGSTGIASIVRIMRCFTRYGLSWHFKRHKDVVAFFNKEFVARGKFPGEMGRRLARLKMKREESDYSDFFIASVDEAQAQLQSVEYILPLIKEFLSVHGVEIV